MDFLIGIVRYGWPFVVLLLVITAAVILGAKARQAKDKKNQTEDR